MNVSAQPKISPFRYPGGKTRLVELVHIWMMDKDRVDTFIEPFAGGASVGLYVASKGLAKKVRLVELDEDVASVWSTILSSDHCWLCKKVADFRPSRGRVLDLLHSTPRGSRELAFRTLVRNRVGRSGLLWNGAGIVRVGERGEGIVSRWYPETLVARIRHINSLRDRISFRQGCGLEDISRHSSRRDVFFVDPPYTTDPTSAGRRLYRHNDVDHDQLFQLLEALHSDFLMTHEDTRKVRAMIAFNSFEYMKLRLLTAQNRRDAELLIGTNLKQVINRIRLDPNLFSQPISRLDFS